MCFDICTMNIRVSIRLCGLRLVFFSGCFSVWGTFPCHLLHFGAKTCTFVNFGAKMLHLHCSPIFPWFWPVSMVFIDLPKVIIDVFHRFH